MNIPTRLFPGVPIRDDRPTAPHARRLTPWIAALAVLTVVSACSLPEPFPPTPTQPQTTELASPSISALTDTTATPVPAPTPGAATPAADALTLLATLPVKGRAPKTGYQRSLFGAAWSDDVGVAGGHNGCDTRNDILHRDLTDSVMKPGTAGCKVLSGTLDDQYSGHTIPFVAGPDTSAVVQIDHLVPLSNAWQTGAQQLDARTRVEFANDPRNLQAVDGPLNQQKSDGDAATWLPPRKAYRCTYVARQIDVKAAYGLWVTPPEYDAMARLLGDCGADVRPAAALSTVSAAPTTKASIPSQQPANSGTAYYANCAAVRAAGAAPLTASDPGYRAGLDGDQDGIACEPKPR